jgi:transcriptional regulator with XRE-family HTH domain
MAANPTIQRRRLGIALKRAREQAKMTQDDAAEVIDAAPSKISRLELGQSGVRTMDLNALLIAYGVDGDEAVSMRDLAKAGRQRGRWSSYRDLLPSWFRQYVDLEGDASEIRWYQQEIIPGILQTEAYIRSMTDPRPGEEAEVDQQVRIRLQRQSVLDQTGAPDVAFVLSESALRRQVGGTVTMCEQLRHLVDVSARLPNVTIQVLPHDAKTYAAASFGFTILRFGHDAATDVVYVEQLVNADYLDSPAAVRTYTKLMDDLRAAALGPVESRLLISQLADAFEKSGP